MIRAVAFVMSVLAHVEPNFQPRELAAETLVELGRERHFDPLTLIAIVENESRWHPGAKSDDGSFGLAQIRAINFAECQDATIDAERCEWRKQSLLAWRMNLMVAGREIETWRKYCERHVGTGLAKFWLQGFQGYDATRGTTCGHVMRHGHWFAVPVPELTRKVLARRKELEALQ